MKALYKSLKSDKLQLFIISFLSLFLELSLIRYIPANIRLIGYFSNLVLLASFLGLGLGILLKDRKNRLSWFPLILFILIVIVGVFRIELNLTSADLILLKSTTPDALRTEPEIIIPLVYLLTVLLFIPIGQYLGKQFSRFKPLTAYSIDILGALFGVGVFTVLSFLSVPAFVWLILISLLYLFLLFERLNLKIICAFLTLGLVVSYVFFADLGAVWSPYYKISIAEGPSGYVLNVNNLTHQFISPAHNREPIYYSLYDQFAGETFERVLIIGAGTGVDTAVDLIENPNVKSIDAVEIDPQIYQIGKKLNPDLPFSDPRVHVIIDDGKNFLQNTRNKYDLIIFAFTDSLTTMGSSSGIRLESYLFTMETLELAKKHLTQRGLLVLCNYYVQDWLIDKAASMLKQTFGYPPYYISYGVSHAAVLMSGPRVGEIPQITPDSPFRPYQFNRPLPVSEDNWPFFYLKEKAIPWFYIKFLAVISFITVILTAAVLRGQKANFDFRFFFFGAGFLLLETKNLATFGLLFGTTWLVNSLVIAAILVFVLLANLISQRFTISSKILYPCLFSLLILNILVQTLLFFSLPLMLRYLASGIFYLSPIFIANLIFSQKFKQTNNSTVYFASNILGAVFGGMLEYAALITGYQALLGFVIVFYLLSLVNIKKS